MGLSKFTILRLSLTLFKAKVHLSFVENWCTEQTVRLLLRNVRNAHFEGGLANIDAKSTNCKLLPPPKVKLLMRVLTGST